MGKCPVCKCKDLKINRNFCDHIMLEEYISCKRCSFYYEFIHGNEKYNFGRYEFLFFWSESKTKSDKKYMIMKERIKKHRKIIKALYRLKW